MQLHKLWEAVKTSTGKDAMDWAASHDHFELWKNQKGYGDTDPEGKHWRSSQVWYREYKECPSGDLVRPQFQNFWHWLIEVIEIDRGDKIKRYVIDLAFLLEIAKRKNGVVDEKIKADNITACSQVMQAAQAGNIDAVDMQSMLYNYKRQYDASIHLDWVIEILNVIRDIAGSDKITLEF